jgi:hypothetical protein
MNNKTKSWIMAFLSIGVTILKPIGVEVPDEIVLALVGLTSWISGLFRKAPAEPSKVLGR